MDVERTTSWWVTTFSEKGGKKRHAPLDDQQRVGLDPKRGRKEKLSVA